MKLVTLINPPILMSYSNTATVSPSAPLGLAYIASALKPFYKVNVVDAIGEGLDQATKISNSDFFFFGLKIEEIIEKIDPETMAIGITCMFSSNWPLHKLLLKKIRERFPNIPIIVGGEHATSSSSDILSDIGPNTFCVLGEGDEIIIELCHYFSSGTPSLNQINGISFLDGQIIKRPRASRVMNIKNFPWPAWGLFPIDNYLSFKSGAVVHNKRTLPILATRGCPYSCKFCSAPNMWGNQTTFREIPDILKEIKFNIDTYQVEHIEFVDIVGLVNATWTKELCQALIKEDLDITITFSSGSRSEVLNEEILSLLKQAKLLRIQYAADSGSTAEAKYLKKNVNFKKLMKSIKTANEIGLPMSCNILIGFPGQRLSDLKNTAVFCFQLVWVGMHDVLIHNFIPYPGTEFFDEISKNKALSDNFLNYEYLATTNAPSLSYVYSFSPEIPSWFLSLFRLSLLGICLILQYLLFPKRIFLTIKNIKNKTPITFFENLIYLKIYKEKKSLKFNQKVDYKLF